MAVSRKTEYVAENIYFITFTICEWQRIFTKEKYFNLVYKWFDYQKENYNNKIHGYVIMPNHFHGLLFLSNKSPEIGKLIQNAKRFLAYEIVKLLKEDGKIETLEIFKKNARIKKGAKHKVFERRYDSKMIDDEKMYYEKLNYIHNNPCNKGWHLAESPEKYEHSSASNYILGTGKYKVDIFV